MGSLLELQETCEAPNPPALAQNIKKAHKSAKQQHRAKVAGKEPQHYLPEKGPAAEKQKKKTRKPKTEKKKLQQFESKADDSTFAKMNAMVRMQLIVYNQKGVAKNMGVRAFDDRKTFLKYKRQHAMDLMTKYKFDSKKATDIDSDEFKSLYYKQKEGFMPCPVLWLKTEH